MKTALSKTQAREKIDSFFKKENFSQEEAKKIKRLAMKFNLKLGAYRKLFCKECLSKLKGKIRVTKTHKIVECASCSYKNKITLY